MASDAAQTPSPARSFQRKLVDGVREAEKRLNPMRRNRVRFIAQYAGTYYSKPVSRRGGNIHEPVNTVNRIVSTIVPHLATNNPKPNIKAKRLELKFQAELFSLAVERVFIELEIDQTLRRLVMDAMFGPGILKTGIATGRPLNENGDLPDYLHDFGLPYVDVVDLDDYVIDAGCRHRSAAWFEGSRVRMPFEDAAESGMYDTGKLEKIRYGKIRDRNETAASVGMGEAGERMLDEIADEVELLELWLPREGTIVTISGRPDENDVGILREAEYVGPETGPYDMLSFCEVPGSPIPAAPVGVWYDLTVIKNRMAHKAKRQAERNKNLVLLEQTQRGDGATVRDAQDGEVVLVADPKAFNAIEFGGINPAVYEAMQWLDAEINRSAGNPDLLGGIAAVSGTATQDEMLEGNAKLKIMDMWKRFHRVLASVTGKVAWYVWTDPMVDIDVLVKRGEIELPAKFKAEMKEGDFLQYEFDVVPYSTMPRTPEEDFDRTMAVIERVILPLLQSAQANGLVLDVQRVAQMAFEKLDIPEGASFFIAADPARQQVAGAQGIQPVTQPGRERRNTRTRKPSGPYPAMPAKQGAA